MKKALLFALLFSLIGFCAALSLQWSFISKEISLESLLIDDPKSLNVLASGDNGWRLAVAAFNTSSTTPYYAAASSSRVWSANGRVDGIPSLTQSVYSYDNPVRASVHYILASPEIVYRNKWPNLYFSDLYSERYPADWRYRSDFANQEHVICGIGKIESCQLWLYWARYDLYILSITFFGPSRGIGASSFQKVVSEIDAYVGPKISGQ